MFAQQSVVGSSGGLLNLRALRAMSTHGVLGEKLRCETFNGLPARVLRALVREWAVHLTPEHIERDALRNLVVFALNVDKHLRLPAQHAFPGYAEPLKAVLRKRYDDMGRRLAGATMENWQALGYFTFLGSRATCTLTGLQFVLPIGANRLREHVDWVIENNWDFGASQLADAVAVNNRSGLCDPERVDSLHVLIRILFDQRVVAIRQNNQM